MNVGAFVCSCGGTTTYDLASVRDDVTDADVVASSEVLCGDGLDGVEYVLDEYDLDGVVATACSGGCRDTLQVVCEDAGVHPDAVEFVDPQQASGWVADGDAATTATARTVSAASAGLRVLSSSQTVSRDVDDDVLVVGDPQAAADLADVVDVTLLANGMELAAVDADLGNVDVERGRYVDVDGRYGEFEVTVEAGVTEDCVDCMRCVHEGPTGYVTTDPVDVLPGASDGEWTECCPTDALRPDGVTRTLEASQVVHPGATGEPRGGRVGFHDDAGPSALAQVRDLAGGTEKPRFLDRTMDVCAAGDSGQTGCTACVDACPHGAVERDGPDDVAFDDVACEGCGACTSACPTGAVRLEQPPTERVARQVETLLDDCDLATATVAFTCDERAARALRGYGRDRQAGDADAVAPPVLPVSVPCGDAVGEAHVLHALAAGADGVLVLGCGDDCKHGGATPKERLVDRLNQATRDFGLGNRVGFVAPDPNDIEAFARRVHGFTESVDASPVPRGDHAAAGTYGDDAPHEDWATHAWALESVRALREHASPERDVIRGLETFGVVEVDDACTFTPTCSSLCPTDALRRSEDATLEFNHERCVNCGACETGCMEDAITVTPGLDLARLDDDPWAVVADGDLLECRRCGDPFTSAASAARVEDEVGDLVQDVAADVEGSIFEYCDDCRAQLTYNV